MSMDQFLAEHYGTKTASAPSQEDLEKQAQAELFAKLAADNGIDLEKLSEEQVVYLWDRTFSKTAEEDKDDKDEKKDDDKEKDSEGDDEVKSAAAQEHEQKKEAAAKLAEADFLGRVMAHSLVNELRKIASDNEGDAEEKDAAGESEEGEAKEAAMPPQLRKALDKGKSVASRAGELVTGSKAKNLKSKAETAIRSAGEAKAKGSKTQKGWEGLAKKYSPAAKDEAKKVKLTRIGLGAAAAGGVAGGAAAAASKKEASAIDELAAVEAVKTAAESGYDIDEASERVAAILTLGVGESEKIAFAQDLDGAVAIRSLELLEAAGYPVTWDDQG